MYKAGLENMNLTNAGIFQRVEQTADMNLAVVQNTRRVNWKCFTLKILKIGLDKPDYFTGWEIRINNILNFVIGENILDLAGILKQPLLSLITLYVE